MGRRGDFIVRLGIIGYPFFFYCFWNIEVEEGILASSGIGILSPSHSIIE